ncbi:MAG: CPBP family intramembrane metalloprotease [Pirellulaceae bacterium]|nr:CPBP family intramembrane metalloprotease [Pirellulaceae bacterium]
MSGKAAEHGRGEWAVLALAMVLPLLITLLYFVLLASADTSWQRVAAIMGKGVQFALPIVWVGLICREMRVPHFSTSRGLAGGFGFGLLVLVLMVVTYQHVLLPRGIFLAATGEIRAKVTGLGVDSLAAYVALGVFYSLIHSLLEEYYWRWFVYGRLRRHVSVTAAITVSSLAFAAHHVILLATYFGWLSIWTWLFSLSVAVGGAFWAWLYQRSGSLVGPWLSHLLVDAAIFLIGYDLVSDLLT